MGENYGSAQGNEHEDDEESPTPEAAEELLKNPGRVLGMLRTRPEMLQNLASGYQAVREGFTDLLHSNDRGANRVKDTADQILESIREQLAREGLSPEQRNALMEQQERLLRGVQGTEKEVRDAAERSFRTVAAIGAAGLSVAVGVVALGYLAKEGKLPLDSSITDI